jgi:hypothetical protein
MPKQPESCITHLCYDPNTHAVPQVNTSLESAMQELHSESLWTDMLVVHLGLLGLRLSISTKITTQNDVHSYNNNILTSCSKSMLCWNPLCKGFILSHFGRACLCGATSPFVHNLTYVPQVYVGTRKICTDFPKVT